MEAEEFRLVREALRAFAADHRCGSAEVGQAERTAAQKALEGLGLGELRGSAQPLASAQECALLAEEYGRQPLTTSFLGTVLLAPEALRLLETADRTAVSEGTPTVALTPDLRFPGRDDDAASVAWDAEGATGALGVGDDGTVRLLGLGTLAPTTDPLRSVRSAHSGGPATELGRQELRDRAGRLPDGLVSAVGRCVVDYQVLVAHARRRTAERLAGRAAGPESSVDKLLMTRAEQRLYETALKVLPEELHREGGAVYGEYLYSRAASVYGGTSQIQRNVIAKRLLRLPSAP
ncbi:acyl-CoA dehydrogenase family protein [Streptomyces canus]|uniref:acyl-CoA dehydrogenase family protein n=1 Tax=Streptomyces canus TaxID=58343 RepID=UPI00368E1C00